MLRTYSRFTSTSFRPCCSFPWFPVTGLWPKAWDISLRRACFWAAVVGSLRALCTKPPCRLWMLDSSCSWRRKRGFQQHYFLLTNGKRWTYNAGLDIYRHSHAAVKPELNMNLMVLLYRKNTVANVGVCVCVCVWTLVCWTLSSAFWRAPVASSNTVWVPWDDPNIRLYT